MTSQVYYDSPLKLLSQNESNGMTYYEAYISLVGDIFYEDTLISNITLSIGGTAVASLIINDDNPAKARLEFESPMVLPENGTFSVTMDAGIYDSGILPSNPTLVFALNTVVDTPPDVVINPDPPAFVPTVLPEYIPKPDLFLEMERLRKGEPVELYEFKYGHFAKDPDKGKDGLDSLVVNTTFRYTSSNEAIIMGGETFDPYPISREEVRQTTDIARVSMRLKVPRINDIARLFIPGTPPFPFAVKVFRAYTFEDNNSVKDFLTVFIGRITLVEFTGLEATLVCDPIYSAIKRQGLRRKYESSCPHLLYYGACGVNKTSFAISPTNARFADETGAKIHIPSGSGDGGFNSGKSADVRDENGLITTVPDTSTSLSNFATKTGYFTGGMLRLADGSFHLISQHEANYIHLLRHIPLSVTDRDTIENVVDGVRVLKNIQIFPGCDRTYATCGSKFHNDINFGGFPWLPDANPFIGTHVPQGG